MIGCPNRSLPAAVPELLHYAQLYKKGLPPIDGGALDQPRAFTRVASFVWQEQSVIQQGSLSNDG